MLFLKHFREYRDKKNLILESTLKDDYDFVDFNKNKDSMKEINETLEKLLK
jgi:hypothetical protein